MRLHAQPWLVATCVACVVCAASACKGQDKPKGTGAGSGSASGAGPIVDDVHKDLPVDAAPPPPGDWAACKPALEAAAKAPVTKRVQTILDGCRPCGDWTPILTWQTTQADGGPNRKVIESTIAGCGGWCDPNAKMRFMGTLDDARENKTRAPWRELGEFCKDKVSAVPDARYMSASYFALDRIARWAATQPDGPATLAAIELELPPVSVTGAGYKLPTAPVSAPISPRAQLSVTVGELRISTLPKAALGATGVTVSGGQFPGELVTAKALVKELTRLGDPVVMFSPEGVPASRIAEVVAAAGAHDLRLGVTSSSGNSEWTSYGAVPVTLGGKPGKAAVTLALGASADPAVAAVKAAGAEALRKVPPTITVDKAATVASLATLLGALAYLDVTSAAVVVSKP